MGIPQVLFQTNKTEPDKNTIDRIKHFIGPEWKYEFYTDEEAIQFFIRNPIRDLPDIINKFNSLKGPHKADLFRYYYLYLKGGFFMDSDAMLCEKLKVKQDILEYDFVSVLSSFHPGAIFQGILAASPKNDIIKKALYKAYHTDPSLLNQDYHLFCKQLYGILRDNTIGYKIKLYQERSAGHGVADIVDGYTDTVVFKHYWLDKQIPIPVQSISISDHFLQRLFLFLWNWIRNLMKWIL